MNDEHISTGTKIAYGAGDFTTALYNTIISVYFPIVFLVDVVHLDPKLAAIAIFAGRSMDWINDPIIGHLSDRTRSRWGRRRPFLLFGMLPMVLVFIFFFWVPPWDNQIALVVYYAVMYMLLDTTMTIIYMPYYALTPELTLDYDERTSLSTWRMLFSILAGLVAFTTPTMIVDRFADPRMGYFVMAMVFGGFGILPVLATFFGTRERPEFQAQQQPKLRDSLKAARGNRPLWFGLGIFLLTWATIDLIMALLLPFIKHAMLMGNISSSLLGAIFVSATVFLPLWNWASQKWNKTTAYIVGMAFFIVILVVLVFLQPTTPLAIVYIVSVLAGVGVAAAHVIPAAIMPDAIEWDELKTGQRHEGMFYSLMVLSRKMGASIIIPVAVGLLGVFGYDGEAAVQPHTAVIALRTMVATIPALLLTAGIIFAWFYPLSREQHHEVTRQLAERRGEATAK